MIRCVAVAALLLLAVPVYAEDKKAPDHMSLVDAHWLDAANAHAQLIRQKADVELQPYIADILDICKRYGIDPAELGKTVGVDPKTGVITRKPKAEAKK